MKTALSIFGSLIFLIGTVSLFQGNTTMGICYIIAGLIFMNEVKLFLNSLHQNLKPSNTVWNFISFLLVLISPIANTINKPPVTSSRPIESIKTTDTTQNKKEPNIIDTDGLQTVLLMKVDEYLKKGMNEYDGSLSEIGHGVKELEFIRKDFAKLNPTSKDKLNEKSLIENKIKKLQSIEYPKFRKRVAKQLEQDLWEDNIKVKQPNSETIEFISPLFYNNKNTKASHLKLSETLKKFRFKRVNYKPYKQVDEYTYFELNSLRDKDLKD